MINYFSRDNKINRHISLLKNINIINMENELLNKYLNNNKTPNRLSKVITKILLSIIFVLSILIINNYDDKGIVNKYLKENNFPFNKFKKEYDKLLGGFYFNNKEDIAVSNNLDYYNPQKYYDGESFQVDSNLVKCISSGVVVYVGPKDNFNNTIIIQTSDGYNIWYGNIQNPLVNIYDYINTNDYIGEVENIVYLKIVGKDKNLTYSEYLNEK